MFKKAGLSILVVMMIAFTAGISSANNAMLYGDSDVSNAFAANSMTSFSSTNGQALIGGALAGAVVAGSVPTAVYVNPGALGDALIYPYFNVNNNNINLFNIVNTADYGVRARIRFFEGRCSTELLDFDVCLSAHDVWTAFVSNKNGVGTIGGLISTLYLDSDTPIDYGQIRGSSNGVLSAKFPNGQAFKTTQPYAADQGCTNPSGGTTVAATDTVEGYFAVIGLNRLDEADASRGAKAGWPAACGQKSGSGKWLNDNIVIGTAENVENVLMGYSSEINLTNGKTFEYNATAIANFDPLIWTTDPVDARPTLADHRVDTTELKDLDFVLTKNTMSASYWLALGTTAVPGTEMIINYPTRKHTYGASVTNDDKFDDKRVAVTIYDDKENTLVTGCDFSPCFGGADVSLPYEVNVLSLGSTSIFTSALRTSVTTAYDKGYVSLDFTVANTAANISPAHLTTATNSGFTFTSLGLPVIGHVVVDIGGGINWMAPMAYTTSVTRVP